MTRRLLLFVAYATGALCTYNNMMQNDYDSSPSAQGGQPAYGQPAGGQSAPPAGGQQKAAGMTHEVRISQKPPNPPSFLI